jgi:hypothetical protein
MIDAGHGITLIGEAAKAYVTYKYFDTIVSAAIFGPALWGLVYCLYSAGKHMFKDL